MYQNIIGLDLAAIDKPTIIIVLAGQVIVVAALFILYKLYTIILPSFIISIKKLQKNEEVVSDKSKGLPEDDNTEAAIAVALYLHFNEMHDEESNVITIQRVSKTYSPWSSKLYNMRNFR